MSKKNALLKLAELRSIVKSAAAKELVDIVTHEVSTVITSDCVMCSGSGECFECNGSGTCSSCQGSGEES